jgi:predicted RNase H-like nuclease (RuvC/YqgF family)
MRTEKEDDLSTNLLEIKKIQQGHSTIVQNKDTEIERLTQVIEHLNQELTEKNIEMESLNEENQKYLGLIIKHSLGGVGGKTLR